MKELLQAITTKWANTNLSVALSDRIYYKIAKWGTETPRPYCVFMIVSDVPDWTFNTSFENVRIQFTLYSDSSSELEDLFAHLKNLFDWCSLTITGNTLVYMRRALAVPRPVDEDGVHSYVVDYEIMTEAT